MRIALLSLILALTAEVGSAITIDTVPIGNSGNAPDLRFGGPGYGAVTYDYRIGQTEITNAQYVAFLNAVAASDPNHLYLQRFGFDVDVNQWPGTAGILRSGDPGSYTYSLRPTAVGQGPSGSDYTFADKPVVFISWYSALRFANWMHNGQPTGAEDASTTEDGAYTFSGPTTVGLRNSGARWWLPSENEWYKAAYYDPSDGHYNFWPTGSQFLAPNNNLPTNDTGNSANYDGADYTTGNFSYPLTNVAAYTNTASKYRTFDQAGNAAEWTETTAFGPYKVVRGGDWSKPVNSMQAGVQDTLMPNQSAEIRGFRIARTAFTAIPGDFNGDGTVDAADYIYWRKTDGTSDNYTLWRSHFGQTSGSGVSITALPESSTLAMAFFALAALPLRRYAHC